MTVWETAMDRRSPSFRRTSRTFITDPPLPLSTLRGGGGGGGSSKVSCLHCSHCAGVQPDADSHCAIAHSLSRRGGRVKVGRHARLRQRHGGARPGVRADICQRQGWRIGHREHQTGAVVEDGHRAQLGAIQALEPAAKGVVEVGHKAHVWRAGRAGAAASRGGQGSEVLDRHEQ